jgi:hypothetical protein
VEIATVDSTVTRIKPVEKPSNANYYQAILEQATRFLVNFVYYSLILFAKQIFQQFHQFERPIKE